MKPMPRNATLDGSRLVGCSIFPVECTGKPVGWLKMPRFATKVQMFFDEKKGRYVEFVLTKLAFYLLLYTFSLLAAHYPHKRSKFTDECICYIQNSSYVCNEIINDS
jgi:hypothetical protein